MDLLQTILPQTKENLGLSVLKREVHGTAYMVIFDDALNSYLQKNWVECQKNSKMVLHITWEHLNTGHWKDVDLSWRYAYSYGSLFKAVSEYHLSNVGEDSRFSLEDAIKTCDMGLLLGAPIIDNILTKLVNFFQKQVIVNTSHKAHTSNLENDPPSKKSKICDKCSNYPEIDKSFLVKSINLPSIESFKLNFMDRSCPVIITGAMDHWPALNKWSIQYIKEIAGCRTVPIEIGSKYTEESWSQKLMLISEFVDKFIESPSDSGVGYLAQHELFDQIPELQDDISIPTYSCLGENDDVDINAWFGPKGTVSPLHHDPKHNFLCQVLGEKYIKLYSQEDNQYVYPHETDLLCNTSQVDVENPDLSRFPDFVNARVLECVLKPGQMLYIPPKYWHYVRSLSTSFSVSFWWE